MGYNTTIVVMNDALHAIAEDEKFGKKLEQAILSQHRVKNPDVSAVTKSGSIHVNAATVIDCKHADITQVIAVGWNSGRVIDSLAVNYHDKKVTTEEKILRSLADKLGFYVSKKPVKKVDKANV